VGTEKEVRIKIRALDRISRTLSRVRRQFPQLERAVKKTSKTFQLINEKTKKFRKTLSKVGAGMRKFGGSMTRAITLPVGLAAAGIIKLGVDFQRSMNRVGALTRTIIGGKVTPQFEALEAQALKLGASTEFTARQVADAMGFMGRAGFGVNEILASTSDVLALASATGMDLAFTADVMTKTIRQFGLEAKDASRVADVLADVSRRTNVDLESISETMKDAAPIAKQYGATLEQTAALTGLLGDVGIQGSKAGTTLKNIFIKLATPSKTAIKLLERMGITIKKTNGEMMSAGEVLTAIGPKIGGLNKGNQLAIMNELFGLRGIAGAMALMSKAMDEGKNPVATLTKILKDNNGVAKDMQKTMLIGAPGALARFSSALEGAGLAFSKSGILDAFTSILETTTGWFTALSKLDPAILKTITVMAALAAAFGPIVIGMGAMLTLAAQLAIIIPTLNVAMIPMAITAGIIAFKIILISAAIGALVFLVTRLIDRWEHMLSAFKRSKGVMSGLKNFFGAFFTDRDEVAISRNAKKGAFPGRNIDRGFDPLSKIKRKSPTENVEDTFVNLSKLLATNKSRREEAGKKLFGPAIGALRGINQIGTRGVTQTNNANVKIDIAAPPGTKVKSEADDPSLFGLNLGMVGSIQ